jgi:hypothetical protein
MDESEVYLVAMVSRFDGNNVTDRQIINSEEVKIYTPAGIFEGPVSGEIVSYPNPFSDRITFEFDLPALTDLKMEITDVMGRHISTVAQGMMGSGRHSLYWNGKNDDGMQAANGIYVARITGTNGELFSTRINLAK